MANKMVTTNISLPRGDWKALKVLAAQQEVSMAELVRKSVKQSITKQAQRLIKKGKLTVNGFTPDFEGEVLKAAAEPVGESKAWESEKDITVFFESVRKKARSKK